MWKLKSAGKACWFFQSLSLNESLPIPSSIIRDLPPNDLNNSFCGEIHELRKMSLKYKQTMDEELVGSSTVISDCDGLYLLDI
jgi:hypothetical protein